MAIAVASGVSPERGLYTAIVGGFLVSALGGSRFQIGGPAGAFIVLVASTVARVRARRAAADRPDVGPDADAARRCLRLGSLIRHIPHAVTVGFTCGIAVTIAASQIKDLGGLHLAGTEPGPLMPKLAGARRRCRRSARGARDGRRRGGDHLVLRRFRPTWPGMLIAVVAASAARRAAAPAGRDHRQPLRRPCRMACRRRGCRDLAGRLCCSCCRRRCPSPCWAGSKACCRPRSPTA